MAYRFGVKRELQPTFLHPTGLPLETQPYTTRFGLEIPGIISSRIELDALYRYIKDKKEDDERIVPTIEQLDKITQHEQSGCWELPIYRDGNDVYPPGSPNAGMPRARYGRMAIKGVEVPSALAHVHMYIALFGPYEEDVLDHLCENKKCCWPRHLDPVSYAENNRRIDEADKLAKGQGTLEF